MNIAALIALIFRLAVPTVLTVEKVEGDAKAGVDKQTMAKDALAGATAGALGTLTGDNAQYAQIASDVAGEAIDAAVEFTRKTGDYQKATAAAATAASASSASSAAA